MSKDKQTLDKPSLDNIEMHMPEGDLAPVVAEPEHRLISAPILVLLVLLLLLILGGMGYWYFVMQEMPAEEPPIRPTPEENNEPESTTAEAQVETMQAVSTSDELHAIEADLQNTNLDILDTEIQAIEDELDQAQ